MEASNLLDNLTVNPAVAGMDNSAIERLVELLKLPETSWKQKVAPSKATDPKVYMWRNVDNEDSSTCIYMKLDITVPDCTIDKMQKCFELGVRMQWEDNQEFTKIGDVQDGALIYIVGPKPKLPMIDQRDFLSKFYHRDAYFVNADGSVGGHASVRVHGGEHASYPPKAGLTRGEEYICGQIVIPAPEVNGVRLLGIIHRDMKGKLPEVVLQKAAEKAGPRFYEAVSKVIKT